MPSSPDRKYQPDPFDLQIGSIVISHRATLLHHDQATHDELIQTSDDFRWYGRYLQKASGASSPWDPSDRNEVTPPEVFLETEDWIGYAQSIPKPSFGGVHRHFRLLPHADIDRGRFRPTPAMANAVAVVELIQHPDKRWQVLHAEVRKTHRRQGIATMLYNRIENILDFKLLPSGWLSEDAHVFWRQRDPEKAQWYLKHPFFAGLWITPKQLLNLRAVNEVKLMLATKDGLPN